MCDQAINVCGRHQTYWVSALTRSLLFAYGYEGSQLELQVFILRGFMVNCVFITSKDVWNKIICIKFLVKLISVHLQRNEGERKCTWDGGTVYILLRLLLYSYSTGSITSGIRLAIISNYYINSYYHNGSTTTKINYDFYESRPWYDYFLLKCSWKTFNIKSSLFVRVIFSDCYMWGL